MKSKEEKDKFYVLQKPEHSILTIIIAGGEFPLPENIHNSIEKLKTISDILFIFDSNTYSNLKTIKKETFASLYGSKIWVDADVNFLFCLLRSFNYEINVFGSHNSVLVANLWEIGDITEEKLKKLSSVCRSSISLPVLKINRLSSENYYKIYKNTDSKVPDILQLFSKQQHPFPNRYCSYSSNSPFVFFRPEVLKVILNFVDERTTEDYISSFTYPDFRYFIASLIKYLGFDHIDASIYDVKI